MKDNEVTSDFEYISGSSGSDIFCIYSEKLKLFIIGEFESHNTREGCDLTRILIKESDINWNMMYSLKSIDQKGLMILQDKIM